MQNYVIITDSTTDLSRSFIEELDITVVPLSFVIDGVEHQDLPDSEGMDPKEFYNALREGKKSITSQINESTFVEIFEQFLKTGKDILYIGFSSALSGTCFQAMSAAEKLSQQYPDRKVIAIDSLCASLGQGLLVYRAAKMRLDGKSIDEVSEFVTNNRLKLCHWFTVDDLNHLKRGGRVSSTAALVGTMLGIKPILHVDNNGKLIPISKIRGRQKSLEALADKMGESVVDAANQVVFISHGDAYDDAKSLADMIKSRFGIKEFIINNIGPVIGSHSGPGTIALFYFGTHR